MQEDDFDGEIRFLESSFGLVEKKNDSVNYWERQKFFCLTATKTFPYLAFDN